MAKRRLPAFVLAVLLVLTLAPAIAGASEPTEFGVDTPPLTLRLVEDETYGHLICGLTASRHAIPAQTLLALIQSITSDDAAFTETLEDDAPAATGLTVSWMRRDGSEGEAVLLVEGDVLGTGVLSLSQLARMASAYVGSEPLEGVYLDAADVAEDGDALCLSDIVVEAQMLTSGPAISEAEEAEIVSNAVELQAGDGSSYSADSFGVVLLKQGDVIYGMLPGQSAFYTNAETVEECGGSYKTMYEMLQMLPHPEFGYREQLGSYIVKEDTLVAAGYCLANSEIDGEFSGPGGGFQFVIPDFETVLELSDTVDLHE